MCATFDQAEVCPGNGYDDWVQKCYIGIHYLGDFKLYSTKTQATLKEKKRGWKESGNLPR